MPIDFFDHFDADDTARWNGQTADCYTQRGRLVVAETAGFLGLTTDATYNLTGSSATVELCQVGLNATYWELDCGNDNSLFWYHDPAPAQLQTYRRNATVDTQINNVTYDPVAHRWLRISESGGTVSWSYSADGISWTVLSTYVVAFSITAATVILAAGDAGININSTAIYDNFNVAPQKRNVTALTRVGSTTWQAPASGTSISPTYPGSLLEGDCIYMILHQKPDTADPLLPASWQVCGSLTGGAGVVGAGTGPTRVTVWKRRVPAAGLSGSQTISVTSGSSIVATMIAYRAFGEDVQFDERYSRWHVTTASTTIGGTCAAGVDMTAGDELLVVIGTPDDQSTTLTLTGLTSTGATLGSLTRDPNATVTNAQGNDISATSYLVPVTAGASTAAPVATATSSSSETAIGFVMRLRATRRLPAVNPPRWQTVHRASYR